MTACPDGERLEVPSEQVHSGLTYSQKKSTIWRCPQFLGMIEPNYAENFRVGVVPPEEHRYFFIFISQMCVH